jgi:alpha-mannosidase
VTADQMTQGWIYSDIAYNNLGTNFAVSQNGELVVRYVISTCMGDATDHDAAAFGWRAVTPLTQILARTLPGAALPVNASLITLQSENAAVQLIGLKRAEDRRGLIARLWNVGAEPTQARLQLAYGVLAEVNLTNAVEEDGQSVALEDTRTVRVPVGAREVTTVRLICEP